MNATASQPSKDRLTADQRANEPSMEEILASIRRIIAEGDATPPSAPTAVEAKPKEVAAPVAPVRAAEAARRDETIVTMPLHRGMSAPEVKPAEAKSADSEFDSAFPRLRGTVEPSAPVAPAKPEEPEEPVEPRLLSSESRQTVSAAFSALAAAKVVQESGNIDSLVREMLRPMLKSWLDDNLPVLVEKLVRAEIERVARGGK